MLLVLAFALTAFPIYAFALEDGSDEVPETVVEEVIAEEVPAEETPTDPAQTEETPAEEEPAEPAAEETVPPPSVVAAAEVPAEEIPVQQASAAPTLTLRKNDGSGAELVFAPAASGYTVKLPSDHYNVELSINNPSTRASAGDWNRQQDGFELAGWYTDADMPEGAELLEGSYAVAKDTVLYAQWKKNSWSWSDLTFYLERSDDEPYAELNLLGGSTVGEDLPESPTDPTGENREFLGWHQKDSQKTYEGHKLQNMSVQPSYDGENGYIYYAEWGEPKPAEEPDEVEPAGGFPGKVTYRNWWYKGQSKFVEYSEGPVSALGRDDELLKAFTTKYGATFDRWNTKEDRTGRDFYPGDTIDVDGEVELFAVYTFKIKFSGGGISLRQASGSYASNWDVTTETVDCGTEYVMPEPFEEWNIRETNRFRGWNGKMYSTEGARAPGDTLVIESGHTFYAVFDPHIVFQTNNIGKTGWYETVYYGPIENGNPLSMPGVDDAMFNGWNEAAHKLFGGWNTAMAGTGAGYAPGQSYSISQNVRVYAQAADQSVFPSKVTYTNWWYKNQSKSAEYSEGPVAALERSDELLKSFTTKYSTVFSRWNTKADGTGRDFYPGDTIDMAGEVELFAIYTAKVKLSAGGLSLQRADGSYADNWDSIHVTVDCGTEYELPELFEDWKVRETNRFRGWNTKMYSTENVLAPGDAITINADWSVYAVFDPHMVFQPNNLGKTGWYDTVYYGPIENNKSFTMPGADDAMFDGWNEAAHQLFGSWNTAMAGTRTEYTPGRSYSFGMNVRVYAQEGAEQVTEAEVTFHDATYADNAPFTGSFAAGDAVPVYQLTAATDGIPWGAHSEENRKFAGWNTSADATGDWYGGGYSESAAANFGEEIPGDLYAQYSTMFEFDPGGMRGQWDSGRVSAELLVGQNNAVPTMSNAMFAGWDVDGGDGYNSFVGWSTIQLDMGSTNAHRYSFGNDYGENVINAAQGELLYAIYNSRVTFEADGLGDALNVVNDDAAATVLGGFELTLPDASTDTRFADWVNAASAAGQVFTGWTVSGQSAAPGAKVVLYGNITIKPNFENDPSLQGSDDLSDLGTANPAGEKPITGNPVTRNPGASSTEPLVNAVTAALPAVPNEVSAALTTSQEAVAAALTASPALPMPLSVAANTSEIAAALAEGAPENVLLSDNAMPLAAGTFAPAAEETNDAIAAWMLVGVLPLVGLMFFLLILWRRRKDEDEEEEEI